jgi:hypothetical protein
MILFTHLCLGLPSGVFPSGFPTNILYAFLFCPICATWPAHFILLDLIILITLGREYNLQCLSLCNFLHPRYFIPLWSKYSPQHPQSMFLPYCQRPRFTSIQNHRQNYSFAYSNFYGFRQQTRGQKVLDRMVASITGVQSPLNFLLNQFSRT